MNPDEAGTLYQNDAEFHALVDMIYYMICQAQLTPFQVKQAAVFACIRYAETHAEPFRRQP